MARFRAAPEICEGGEVCCFKKAPAAAFCIPPSEFEAQGCEKLKLPCNRPSDCPGGAAVSCCVVITGDTGTVTCLPNDACRVAGRVHGLRERHAMSRDAAGVHAGERDADRRALQRLPLRLLYHDPTGELVDRDLALRNLHCREAPSAAPRLSAGLSVDKSGEGSDWSEWLGF